VKPRPASCRNLLTQNHQDPGRGHMFAHNLSMHSVRRFAPTKVAAGVLVTLAMLSACSNDSVSRINGPPPLSLTRSDDHSSGSGSGSGSGAGSNFAVLAHTAVSCSGGSITGDVGTFQAPGELPPGVVTLTTGCLVNGAIHVGDAAAKAAFNSFLTAYAALAPKTGDVCPVITGTLAGQTLTPGTYCVSSEAKTGTLTLAGPPNGIWVIKVPSGALTGTSFSVVMSPGAQACNVTWWVDAAATMTTSAFQGNILAGAGITMTASTSHGNAWAKADVTFTEGTVVTGCAGNAGNGNGGDNDDGDKDHGDKDHDKCNPASSSSSSSSSARARDRDRDRDRGHDDERCDHDDKDHHGGNSHEGEGDRGHSGKERRG
jgi:hypothetical protein